MRNGCVCAIGLCDWWPVVSLMVCSGFVLAEVLFNGGGFCFGLLVDFVK